MILIKETTHLKLALDSRHSNDAKNNKIRYNPPININRRAKL